LLSSTTSSAFAHAAQRDATHAQGAVALAQHADLVTHRPPLRVARLHGRFHAKRVVFLLQAHHERIARARRQPAQRAHVVELAVPDGKDRTRDALPQLVHQRRHQRHVVGHAVQRVAHRHGHAATHVQRHQRRGADQLPRVAARRRQPLGRVLDLLAVPHDHLEPLEAAGQARRIRAGGHQPPQPGGALAQQRPAQLYRRPRQLAVEVALVDRLGAVTLQLDEQPVGAAAVTDQGVAHQAQKVLEAQDVLVAATAMRLPDRFQQPVIEDEVTGFQHASRQRRAPHQFLFEGVHALATSVKFAILQRPSTCASSRTRKGWG